MGVPTVTEDTAVEGAASSAAPDPAARIRRLLAASPDEPPTGHAPTGAIGAAPDAIPVASPDPTGLLAAALARFDAPVDLRILGGLGSGRRTLAAALRARQGWRVTVEDIDVLAVPGARPTAAPDVEIVCLRTAPCRHEEAWLRRPRLHPVLVVATVPALPAPDGGPEDNPRDHEQVQEQEQEQRQDQEPDDDDTTTTNPPPGHRSDSPHWARGLLAVDARTAEHRSVDEVIAFVDRAVDGLAALRVARLEAELERLAVHPEVGELAEAALCAIEF